MLRKLLIYILITFIFYHLIACKEKKSEKEEYSPDRIELVYLGKKYFRIKVSDFVHIRKEPSIHSKIIGNAKNGELVLEIIKTGKKETIGKDVGEWIEVVSNHSIGFIFSKFLSELNEEESKLYSMSIEELEKLASITKDKKVASNYYKLAHQRYLIEGNSPYCSPGSDSFYCMKACNKSLELDYCEDFNSKGSELSLPEFQKYLIDSLKNKDYNALYKSAENCIVNGHFCTNCDGGGTLPIKFLINGAISSADEIDYNNVKIFDDAIIFSRINKEIIDQNSIDFELPDIQFSIIKRNNLYYLQTISGKEVMGGVSCMSGV